MAKTTRKIDSVTRLINRKSGATMEQIQTITGWQPHSIRAAISGLRKRGMTVTLNSKSMGGKIYKAGSGGAT